ncbi:hypothetical protein B566_EDAN009636 [Ephemera danica]|nr:hypothetical protein B566_EDAN009636 [Ephemera danica]
MTTAVSNRKHLTQQQQPSFIINFLAWLLNAALDIGTLLTVGFGLLLSFLLVFGCLTLGLFAAGAAAYLGLQRLRSILDSILVFTQSQKGVSNCKTD